MATINGTSGDDSLTGTSSADTIQGFAGDDTINGEAGHDTIYGGDGNDLIYGDDGYDDLYGGSGSDTIYGGAGNDEIEGNDGDDYLSGGDGRDEIEGGSGNDTIYGGDGDDEIEAGNGDDLIYGGAGDDDIEGNGGDDTIYADGGDDTIDGDKGSDTFVITAASDSIIEGGEDSDDSDVDVIVLNTSDYDYSSYIINYTDDDPSTESGTIELYDEEGTLIGTITFSEIEEIVCFTPGTRIATPNSEVSVESLKVGDKVHTRDNGVQEIVWTGRKFLTAAQLAHQKDLIPILIEKGALGDGLPEQDLIVSPQHRILLHSARAALYFEDPEVLAPAIHLVGLPGIMRLQPLQTSYVHFMCENHELVLSNGSWTETFQPGKASLSGLKDKQRDEIITLFPELGTEVGRINYTAARKTLKRYETKLFLTG